MKRLVLVFLVLLVACGDDDNPCPDGTEQVGTPGVEVWCAEPDGRGGWIYHGPCKRWSAGHLVETGRYCRGNRCGTWTLYSNDGQKISEGDYSSEGERCGVWRQWSDGELTSEEDHGPC